MQLSSVTMNLPSVTMQLSSVAITHVLCDSDVVYNSVP